MNRSRAGCFKARVRGGFTLVELLVVLGIIALITSIALPTIFSMRRKADRDRTRIDLQAIAQALDAYKADFGDYPRPAIGGGLSSLVGKPVLTWALLSPMPATKDGADGPGFRTIWNGSAGGKIYGPYLPIDKFKLGSGYSDTNPNTMEILDRYGQPIEYFVQMRKPGLLNGTQRPLFGAAAKINISVYDYRHGSGASVTAPPIPYLQKALGDDDLNDTINASETLRDCPPFILVSKGPLKDWTTDPNDIKTKFAKLSEITNLEQ